jgi:hypothetical protein
MIFIHGTGIANQHLVEKIPPERLRWYFGLGSVTSERVYTNVEDITIQGVAETDRVVIKIVGFDSLDQTVLLPIWAGIPGKERADLLINNTILNRDKFWQPFGIRACANPLPSMEGINPSDMVYLHWNTYIGEGLVNYGYRTEAAELFYRIMSAVILNLKQGKAFRKYYDAYTGIGGGDRNALSGLAPVGLFLHILGVKIVSPTKVEITGINPYPWPVTVKYRGLTVLRQNDRATVIFPNSQVVSLEGTENRIVALE